jgi:hypothetical protein
MRILGLDISTKCGWAIGEAGQSPRFDVERLRPKQMKDERGIKVGMMDRVEASARHMGGFIRDLCFIESERPELIAYEAAILPFVPEDDDEVDYGRRNAPIQRNMDSILTPLFAIGALIGVAGAYGIPVIRVANQTWMKHYTGRARHGSRDAAKAAALKQGKVLGHLPFACTDTDIGDAVGVWDWAAHKFGRRNSQQPLQLFDEGRMRHG